MRQSLVVANWKMNGSSAQLHTLLNALIQTQLDTSVETIVCPVSIYLSSAQQLLSNSHINIGAQNVAMYAQGAYTGEVSASMLADIGVQYCILGHSERRTLMAETNAMVAAKAKQCLAAKLTPIICVGETLKEHEQGKTLDVIAKQVKTVINDEGIHLQQLVFAYEPVWAIGTGETASPAQAQDVHAYIRSLLTERNVAAAQQVRILYGGSVKAENAAQLMAQPDIDGGLIGGASLDAESFAVIVNAAG